MTPKTPEEELRRAGDAKQILESPLFLEVRAHIEGALAEQRRTVPLRETEMHTKLIVTEQCWLNLLDYLQQIVTTGRMAEFTVAQQQSKIERLRAAFRR
jgi:hypothetical protein